MKAKSSVLVDQVTNSYWFVPAMMTAGAFALSILTLWIDDILRARESPVWFDVLIYSGGPDGAREVLSVVAGSMITVAGVVFSITIVALTLASSQFGPRLLASFMSDRGNQLTLGTFVATFLYALMVLRTVRTGDVERVPHLSVAVALLLAIAGLSVLIFYIHHISVMIQAPNLIAAISREVQDYTSRLFPSIDGIEHAHALAGRPSPPSGFDTAKRIESRSSGYVEAVDIGGLLSLATDHDLIIRLETRPGKFVVQGSLVAQVWPMANLDEKSAKKVARTITVGSRATATQDIEFPLKQLAEIAVRSLSPGINDPYTASSCIDHLSIGLCSLAERELPPVGISDEEGRLRLLMGAPLEFDALVEDAFDQIRQNAAHHTVVYVGLLDAMARVVDRVSSIDRLQPLTSQSDLIFEQSRDLLPTAADHEAVAAAYRRLSTAVQRMRTQAV